MPSRIDGVALGAIGVGSIFVYAGIKGYSIPQTVQDVITGKTPTGQKQSTPITGDSSGGSGVASINGYVNPLSRISNLIPERIDMGVDYSGSGPVLAIGSGKIVNVTNFGWPNSTFICIHLDSGAYAGKYVYFAEDLSASVSVGQHVNAGDVIGIASGGLEFGWAEAPGTGNALGAPQFNGSNSTAYGASFNKLMVSLGAPSGKLNNKPTGTVGAGYP